MAANVSEFLENLTTYQYQPGMIQKDMLDMLTQVTNGAIQVVDPTNPFVFNLEAACVMISGFLSKDQTLTRKQYPSVAQTQADLFLHMSDFDYIGLFAVPSNTNIGFAFDKQEILNNLVTDPTTGIAQIVIPRNTTVTVNATVFSFQYPVIIRQMQHGGLQIVYDATEVTPLLSLETNVIDWETLTNSDGDDQIYFELNLQQLSVKSLNQPITNATAWKMTFQTTDQYYFTRAWVQNADKTWTEIATTMTAEVYDPANPTAVVQVNGTTVTVSIPQIYTVNGQLNSVIRCDFYETQGDIALDLGSYPSNAFQADFTAIDANDNTIFTAPMSTLKSVTMMGDAVTIGGANALSFLDLRDRVINNTTGVINIPITPAQLQGKLNRDGYSIVENVDNITDRTFLATKPMPDPTNTSLITAANASIETLTTTMTALAALSTVIDNGASLTITPDTIYKNVNGIIQVAPAAEITAIKALVPTQRALAVNQQEYYYTPFHYVLDTTGIEFAVRPYYLDGPTVLNTTFVAENDTSQLQVSTKSYALTRTDTGYALTVVVTSSDPYKALTDAQCFAQLSFIPVGETARAYLNGTLQGLDPNTGERVFLFDLSSTLNVDVNDDLELTQFKMFTTDARIVKTALTAQFDIVYGVNAVMPAGFKPSAIDSLLGLFLIPITTVGITNELIRLEFGDSLTTLWSRARSVSGSIPYQTYATDVPQFYTLDVYQADANGSYVTFDDEGNPVLTKLHGIGDPVLDAQGNQVYAHRAGDVVMDPDTGQPIAGGVRDLLRQIDIMMLEGTYYFANDSAAVAYRAQLVTTILAWLIDDLEPLSEALLENTEIFFYPQATLGDIMVVNQNGLKVSIKAGQQLTLTLYVPPQIYANDDVREQLTDTSISTLNTGLQATTVSLSNLEAQLLAIYGTDVVDAELSGLGGAANYPVFTVLDSSNRCGLRKILVAQGDDTLIVSEAVSVLFMNYDPTSAGAAPGS